ncbi:CU044_5270 family protein [Streptomyces termitum]|uniref:CU044_5270 family protein n=1 Tax=Streptomyces termitum TaxID=67368 RepID=A0A918T4B5_9ACTN|nr:CU044_5270 family protein [Streptomyces termitum]GHA89251.1 hypothetical protein GCM10010305_36180 [Streptomyces termitum]
MIRNFRRAQEPLDHAELARLLPAPGDPDLRPDRRLALEEHLMQQIQHAPAPAPEAPRPARPRRRTLLVALPVAAAAVAGVLAFQLLGSASHDGTAAPLTRVPAPVVRIEAGSAEKLDATIRQISTAAARQREPKVGPGQFLYVKSQVSYLVTEVDFDKNTETAFVQELHPREVWKSRDGSRGYLIEPGNSPAGGEPLDTDVPSHINAPSYDLLRTLPTDPDALLAKIYAEGEGKGRNRYQQAFTTIGDLVGEQAPPAGLASALYRAAAKIPGVVVVEHAKDAAGRDGLAVARTDETAGERTELIFDRRSFTYLGQRTIQVEEVKGLKPGTVTGRTAVIERGVADVLGNRPGTGGA